MGIVTDCELGPNVLMTRSISSVAERLIATQRALGMNATALCKETGISQTQWTQFTDPDYKRRITVTAAYKLKDAFGITLEWIYDGDRTKLPHDVALKLREAA